MERPQERVLAHVLGVVAADHPRRNAEDDRAMPVHELLVGGEITVQRLCDQDAVPVRALYGVERAHCVHRAER